MSAAQNQFMSRRRIIALLLTGGTAFCFSLFFILFSDPLNRMNTGNSSYSGSAIGHAALRALLLDQGFEVRINRNRAGRDVTNGDLLLILEPEVRPARASAPEPGDGSDPKQAAMELPSRLQELIQGKEQILIALPKWRPDAAAAQRAGVRRRRDHVQGVVMIPTPAVQILARVLLNDDDAHVLRNSNAADWITGTTAAEPELKAAQLIRSSVLEPLVSNGAGILIGRIRGTAITVLSDPDLIANHGLRMGGNARLALNLIQRLLPPGGAVYLDEALHGFEVVPSLPRLLFRPPFVSATLLGLASLVLLAWIGTIRFGAPLAPAKAALSGNILLMRNAGRLLAASGNDMYIAERYGDAVVDEASRRFHLPQGLRHRARSRRALARIARRRGVKSALPDSGTPSQLVRSYYRWMEELFDADRTSR